MRLRNKKTGKIWHMPRLRQPTVQEDDISFFACISEHGCSRGELFSYKTLDELNEDWGDYKPAEPLIKDEKIRKAIKVWARLNEVKEVMFDEYWHSFRDVDMVISFLFSLRDFDCLEDGKTYTIAELCGEEEE